MNYQTHMRANIWNKPQQEILLAHRSGYDLPINQLNTYQFNQIHKQNHNYLFQRSKHSISMFTSFQTSKRKLLHGYVNKKPRSNNHLNHKHSGNIKEITKV